MKLSKSFVENESRIRRENVHLEREYLFNPYSKTIAAKRKVPLSERAADELRYPLNKVKGVYLFPGRGVGDAPILKANNAHTATLERCGVRRFRLYDLRHTWATRAAMAGVDLLTLAAMQLCESVIWGRQLAETKADLIEAKKVAKSFEFARDQLKQEKEEEKRRKEEERKRKGEEFLQRNREMVGSKSSAPVASPAQPNPWASVGGDDDSVVIADYDSETGKPRVTSDPDGLLKHLMGDTQYSLMVEAQGLLKVDEQGRRRVTLPVGRDPYDPTGPQPLSLPPPDDGRDPFYHDKMAYYKKYWVWPTEAMLQGRR